MASDAKRDAEALLRAGIYWQVNREYEKAIANLERALELDPSSAEAHRALGQTLSYRAAEMPADSDARPSMLERAEKLVRDAIRLAGSETASALHDLAWIFDERGDLAAASEQYRRALAVAGAESRENDLTPLRYNLACSLAKMKQLEEALAELRPVLQDPWRGEIWRWAEKDPDFDNLRTAPGVREQFATLIAAAKERESAS
jgi:tetratricopeptide (TPR) repeat protein